ncbi:MAG: caspase family protein, partial [Aquificaceae bacterium]|nr:caspase family protein [Aquificaceae bacterium]MDW8237421.1 caspase family protein [Aquificaceae bacterium]
MRLSSALISLIFALTPVFAQELDSPSESQKDEVIEKANEILRKAGVSGARVQKNPEGKLVLAGAFATYDEFLFSIMLMNNHFGFEQVKPLYDTRLAIIKKTPTELCFIYTLRGQECPHGRFAVEKPVRIAPVEARKFALVIGVSKFLDPSIPPVAGADADARAFEQYLRENGYRTVLLVDNQATVDNVRKALRELYSIMPDGSELVVFAASHGAPVDERGEVGIVLYDSSQRTRCQVDPKASDRYIDASLKMCSLVKNAFSIKEHVIDTFANRKVNIYVVLDACYSGDALRSYTGLDSPYYVATTAEYERALRGAPNLDMMITASSGDRMSWGGTLTGEFRNRLVGFAGSNPRIVRIETQAQAQAQTTDFRAITMAQPKETKRAKNTKNRPQQQILEPSPRMGQQAPQAASENKHGVFTAFFLEALQKNNGLVAKSYEEAYPEVNTVSKQLCLQVYKSLQKCPPD